MDQEHQKNMAHKNQLCGAHSDHMTLKQQSQSLHVCVLGLCIYLMVVQPGIFEVFLTVGLEESLILLLVLGLFSSYWWPCSALI